MPLLNYALIIIGFPILLAIVHDIKIIVSKVIERERAKQKEKEAKWEGFISEKYEEMKMWNLDIEYDDVKKIVMKSVKSK